MTALSDRKAGQLRTLADGHEIPRFGLGVWQTRDGAECVNAVGWALELGYRLIDTAQAYGNERSVGKALRESGVPREEIFITTKFYPARKDPVHEIEGSLRRLGIDYVDLYIVHWPRGGPTWAWPGMEKAKELGHARSIGISNFGVDELHQVMAVASVPPVVNQVQFSPFEYRRGLLEENARQNVLTEAYSPLGTGRHLKDKSLKDLADRLGRTPAQVLIRWSLKRGLVVIPKSVHRHRIEENARVFDFELSDEEMAELDSFDRTGGSAAALEDKWW